jgi:hypothetical protein
MAWNGDAFATLSLSRTWKRNTLVLGYDGGSTFDIGQYSQSSHSLSISQLLSLGRWSLTISDQALYSPESPFGLPGLQPTFFNFLGTNPVLLPNQTVFTGHAPRISNGSVVQLEYAISRRTSLTATGSYSLLRYTGASFNDSHQGGGTLGYNYAVTPRDNVALVYGYEQMHFNLTAEKMDVQSATLRYSHQLLGRFSIQIEGGAELTKTVSPFSPPRTSVLPNGRLALISVWRRTEFSLSASRSVMSGAGLGVATNGTTASLAATRTLSRTWIGTINGGYAQNAFIGVQGKLRSAFAEASLERTVGRHMGLFFFYNLQKQIGDSVCASSLCAGGYLRHSAGVGLNWRFKPNTSR